MTIPISIKDGLPVKGEQVFCYHKKSKQWISGAITSKLSAEERGVTHWLPQPPAPEQEIDVRLTRAELESVNKIINGIKIIDRVFFKFEEALSNLKEEEL